MMSHLEALQRLDAILDDRKVQIVDLRHYLHRHPELSRQEFKTTSHLADLLGDEGIGHQVMPTRRGLVVNLLNGRGPARRVAFRADMDALPIQDGKKNRAYQSQVERVMHACGHDVHSAALWGALVALHQLLNEYHLECPIDWRFLFQPAEEVAEGAREMIHHGALDGVEAIYCVHVEPTLTAGTLGLKTGVLMAACDLVEITIRGRGAHGARPHQSRDPVAAAFQLGQALYGIGPRSIDSRRASVFSLCQVHAGSSNNVIPVDAKLGGTLRTMDLETRDEWIRCIRAICQGVATATDTEIQVEFSGGVPQVFNDEKLMVIADRVARRVVGESNVATIELPSMGAEDFAFYLERIPGALIRVGSSSDDVGAPPLHTPNFDVDDRGLIAAARFFAHLALEWSYSHSQATG